MAIYSLNTAGGGEFSLGAIDHDDQAPWTNYVRGMAQMLQDAGYPLTGFDGLLHTTVPVASGLSSSAALEMAVGCMFAAAGGFAVDPVQLAILGQRAENSFVGVNCGILDQYTSSVGKAGCALLLDARELTSRDVPIAPGIQVVICDTCYKRELTGSEYGRRRAACEEGVAALARHYPGITHLRDVSLEEFAAHAAELSSEVARRCRFIIEENAWVLALADALAADDREAIRTLTAASFAGACDLYEIVVLEMQMMAAAMLAAPGCIGARQAGAGFGGCLVAFVETAAVPAFAEAVAQAYATATGVAPRIYPVAAAAGAGRVE